MAYHLTGMQAYKQAVTAKLKPVQGGLQYTAQQQKAVVDATGKTIVVPEGVRYSITGTKNSDGYVVTFSAPLDSTHYFEAEVGCKLC
jgi:hypothetical protein